MKTQPVEILLVEDNLGDAKLIENTLLHEAKSACRVTCVTHLSQAVTCLTDVRFDLILLDLGLPDSRGLDTLVQLAENVSSVPILILTSADDEELGESAILHGAQDYLVKGHVVGTRLWRAIRFAIERQRLLLEHKQTEKLRTLLETAGGTAHEINQPLTAVIGYSELVLNTLPPTHECRPEVKKIRDAGLKIQEIVKQMQNIKQYVTKPYLGDINIVDFVAASENTP